MGICITVPQTIQHPEPTPVIIKDEVIVHTKEHWPMNWIPPKECRLDKYIYDNLDETY